MSLSACSHVAVLDEANYSLAHIRKGIEVVLPGGIRATTQNQRMFTSAPFPLNDPKTKLVVKLENAEKLPVRGMAYATILGDRRPYKVEISVVVQVRRRRSKVYDDVKQDQRMARSFIEDLRNYLVKSQESRDLIDEFRPF